MCFRQKTESSRLDGCHNTLQFCPEVVRIVLPCKKYFLLCAFSRQMLHGSKHTQCIQVTCIELWTALRCCYALCLSVSTAKGQMAIRRIRRAKLSYNSHLRKTDKPTCRAGACAAGYFSTMDSTTGG